MDYPELAARTRGFKAGEPRAVSVAADGSRVAFLRSSGPDDAADQLWVFDVTTRTERLVCDPAGMTEPADADTLPATERALRERLRLSASGIGTFATDPSARVAAFSLAGTLVVADLRAEAEATAVRAYPTPGPVVDPRPDPTGQRVGYVTEGTLRVLDLATAADTLLAAEVDNPDVTWGLAEFIAAEEFRRYRGFWWSPDGTSVLAARVDTARVQRWHLHDPALPDQPGQTLAYPAAGTANASVTLHLLDLDGGWVDVHWDRETYPYLVSVAWSETGGPLITVLRRLQQHGLVLAIDPRTGETQVHAELADPRWVEPVPGSPCYLADGRVLIGGELAHDGYDARCLFADGGLLTPASLYVRRICGRLGPDLLVEASESEPSEQHLYRVGTRSAASVVEVRRLTTGAGWHVGHAGAETLVVGASSLDHPGTRWTVSVRGAEVGQLSTRAATPPYAPRPALARVTDRRLPSGVLYPRTHVTGRKLPVLVDIYGGPGHQEVVATRSTWLERQWWADAGFAVVVVDNRGTPGVAPSFEKVIHRRVADIALADQVEALLALADKHPDLDTSRVAIRGWSFGGWLAALATLRRGDIYRCGIAGAPVTDWALYDTAYAERYLGLPADAGEVYAHNSVLDAVADNGGTAGRPLLLIHGMVDDNVVAAHTLRLSAALLAAGHPHAVIPLPGATHMAAGGIAQRLLRLELDFLHRNLA
ncbi:MAG TPA: prolyl oligopeptidase family serine peptidase [Micromonosporaceae bacterium]